jgi:hypothetical protein
VRRAPALAANSEDVDVVAHNVGKIDRNRLVRKRRETDAAAAVDHPRRLIQRVRGTGTFEDILHPLAAGDPMHRCHGIFIVHVDDGVGAELLAHFQPAFSRAG